MTGTGQSPYLIPGRLADVIAAIQAMGTYRFYKLDFAEWSDRITGTRVNAGYWMDVFLQHPEFFRLDSARGKASLVWRRQHQKLFDVDAQRVISRTTFDALTKDAKARISRRRLTSNEISTLIQTATELHSRAIEESRENRWLLQAAIGFGGALIGGGLSFVATLISRASSG